MNQVKLYSNGTAVVSREYELKDGQPLSISIPVRKSDLDDVITSISVFGDVTVVDPPTYSPTNAQETALTLNPASALVDMATKLAGAEVEIQAGPVFKGRLVGLERSRRERDGAVAEQVRLVILTEKGVQQIEDLAITAIKFSDPAIRAEIEKALRSSVGKIKPDSSVVEMTLKPHAGPTTAVVVYATPVAAWKIRYQLRLSDAGAELEGHAVVDNDTDDDWTSTMITVVSGEPITFSTDLAEISRPARSRLRMVANRAAGAVTAAPAKMRAAAMMAPPSDASGDCESPAPAKPYARAKQAQAEVQESGDFSIFASPNPITLGSKRSAIIPLFQTAVGEYEALLFFKEADDRYRPFRAVRFKNPASFSLGRGVCEVMIDGEFRGKSVLGPAMSGQEALVIHAKETGVRISREWEGHETRVMAIKISRGTVYQEVLNRRKMVYLATNNHPESFTLEIEHPQEWKDSKLEVASSAGSVQVLDVHGGKRLRATLPARATLKIEIQESSVEGSRFDVYASWLVQSVIELKKPGSDRPEIQACVKLEKRIDGIKYAIQLKEEAAGTILAEQERLLKLIPKARDEQSNAWRTDLATQEDELRLINRTQIPDLKADLKKAYNDLHTALKKLTYEWSPSEPEPAVEDGRS